MSLCNSYCCPWSNIYSCNDDYPSGWKSDYVNPYILTQSPEEDWSDHMQNHHTDSPLYVWPDVWSADLHLLMKSMVIHDTKCPYWDQVSLNNTNQTCNDDYLCKPGKQYCLDMEYSVTSVVTSKKLMVYVAMTMGNPRFKSPTIYWPIMWQHQLSHMFVTTKHMAWDLCFVPEQNTNQKVYFFVLSMNYRSDWCAINIYYLGNILPA